ncbi:O-antigen translocase, partial [Xanthomonas hortorum pv. gardneri]
MNLIRSSAYTGVATLAKLLAALVVVKLVAVYAGPQGVGRLGQFLNLMSVLAVFAG